MLVYVPLIPLMFFFVSEILTTPNGCATHSGLHSCWLQSSLECGFLSWSHTSSSTSYSISLSTICTHLTCLVLSPPLQVLLQSSQRSVLHLQTTSQPTILAFTQPPTTYKYEIIQIPRLRENVHFFAQVKLTTALPTNFKN